MQEVFHNVVGAAFRTSPQNDCVLCPRTRDSLWQAPLASKQDLNDAVSMARDALPRWAASSWETRQGLLRRFASLLSKHSEFLVSILAKETGKSVRTF